MIKVNIANAELMTTNCSIKNWNKTVTENKEYDEQKQKLFLSTSTFFLLLLLPPPLFPFLPLFNSYNKSVNSKQQKETKKKRASDISTIFYVRFYRILLYVPFTCTLIIVFFLLENRTPKFFFIDSIVF